MVIENKHYYDNMTIEELKEDLNRVYRELAAVPRSRLLPPELVEEVRHIRAIIKERQSKEKPSG